MENFSYFHRSSKFTFMFIVSRIKMKHISTVVDILQTKSFDIVCNSFRVFAFWREDNTQITGSLGLVVLLRNRTARIFTSSFPTTRKVKHGNKVINFHLVKEIYVILLCKEKAEDTNN